MGPLPSLQPGLIVKVQMKKVIRMTKMAIRKPMKRKRMMMAKVTSIMTLWRRVRT